jgi:hypothetical protein
VRQLIAERSSSAEVAKSLYIGIRTFETHRQNIMGQLGIYSIAGLTRFATRHRLCPGLRRTDTDAYSQYGALIVNDVSRPATLDRGSVEINPVKPQAMRAGGAQPSRSLRSPRSSSLPSLVPPAKGEPRRAGCRRRRRSGALPGPCRTRPCGRTSRRRGCHRGRRRSGGREEVVLYLAREPVVRVVEVDRPRETVCAQRPHDVCGPAGAGRRSDRPDITAAS